MTVKAKRGRRRYIAFCLAEGRSHEDGLHALSRMQLSGIGGFKVIQYDHGAGILRCAGPMKEKTIEQMRAQDVLVPLRTSGTLRSLREERRVKDDVG